jgi:CRISPR-associated protein Cas2
VAVTAGVLAYDIADDRRRARVYRLLQEYGLPVQESVFWLELAPSRWAELEQRLRAITDGSRDDVRVWTVCASCRPKARVWCGVPRDAPGAVMIV